LLLPVLQAHWLPPARAPQAVQHSHPLLLLLVLPVPLLQLVWDLPAASAGVPQAQQPPRQQLLLLLQPPQQPSVRSQASACSARRHPQLPLLHFAHAS
jgi:hypothetical protein